MDMKIVDSFKENIKIKTTNPFFGSLIIVWVVHNWRLLYKIFNFSDKDSIEQRISYIATYLDPPHFLSDLGWCIFLAFLVFVTSYSLLSFSRLISNFFEKMVTPFVYKITDKSSIVTKEAYDLLNLEKDHLSDRLDTERKNRANLQNDLDDLEKKYSALQIEFGQYKSQKPINTELHSNNTEFDKSFSRLKELANGNSSAAPGKEIVLTESQEQMLKEIAEEGPLSRDNFITQNDKVVDEYDVDELIQQSMVYADNATDNIQVTHKGREYLIKNKLVSRSDVDSHYN